MLCRWEHGAEPHLVRAWPGVDDDDDEDESDEYTDNSHDVILIMMM